MGAVYHAWDTVLDAPCALKVNLDTTPESERQFGREAKLLANLRHPNLPRVIDYFFVSGQAQYLVMDLVEGQSLGDMLRTRGKPFSENEITSWILQVCQALDYLHTRTPPIIHRDIKPQNIIVTADGRAMLVDFGISKSDDSLTARTTLGARAVTPGYSAPEQYGFGGTDLRSDIYSLAATIFELLTGTQPPESIVRVAGTSSLEFLPTISPFAQHAIRTAMSLQPSGRFGSVMEFAEALFAGSTASRPGNTRSIVSAPPPPTSYAPVAPAASLPKRFQIRIRLVVLGLLAVLVIVLVSLWVSGLIAGGGLAGPIVGDEVLWIGGATLGLLVAGAGVVLGGRFRHRQSARQKLRKEVSSIAPSSVARSGETIIGPARSDGTISPSVTPTTRRTSRLTRRLVVPDMIAQRQGQVLDELILTESFDRLKSFISHSRGGRFVLTGYGRFGGTSLVRGAVRQAQLALAERGEKYGALLVFYFEVKEDLHDHSSRFEVKANEYTMGVLTGAPIEAEQPRIIKRVELTTALDKSFFRRNVGQKAGDNRQTTSYTIEWFGREFGNLQSASKSELQSMLLRLLGQEALPSRVVIVLDRIRRIETLEMLNKYELFRNDQLSVIAVARKEDADLWERGTERLRGIGFQQWYVPCFWHSGGQLRHRLREVLFTGDEPPSSTEDEEVLEGVLKHFEFKGHGIFGDTLDALKHPDNWYANDMATVFDFEAVSKQAHVQMNAWLQDMLDLNWGFILGSLQYSTLEVVDRARIGVYDLLEWIVEKAIFDVVELMTRATAGSILISSTPRLRDMAVRNLMYVLERSRFLKREEDENYQFAWRQDLPPAKLFRRRDPNWKLPKTPETMHDHAIAQRVSTETLEDIPESVLHNALATYFNVSELEELTSNLGFNPEEIKGDTISARALDLIGYLRRRNRLPELVDAVRKARPGQL